MSHEGPLDAGITGWAIRNGEAVRMSKRTGEMVTFEELLDKLRQTKQNSEFFDSMNT